MDSQSKEIAQILLETESVKVNLDEPFTWASGIKSPIYCDNRRMISFPKAREIVTKGLANLAAEFGEFDCIAGTATAGIPWASFVAQVLGKPMVYVRSKPKRHGAGKQVEGYLEAGQKVLIIEDLLSTGGSVLDAAEALKRECEAEVVGIIAIFAYELALMKKNMDEAGVKYLSLSSFEVLSELLVEQNQITEADKEKVLKFMDDPQTWFANLALRS